MKKLIFAILAAMMFGMSVASASILPPANMHWTASSPYNYETAGG